MTAVESLVAAPPLRTGDGFAGEHVLSMQQYEPDHLAGLFAVTDLMADPVARLAYGRLLSGRVLMSAFFERSTRTRLSFETAMLRLGGTVSGFADPSSTRAGGGITRESDHDVARMLSLYADVAVVRHPETGWPAQAAEISGACRIVNGGDGTGEHPTQSLIDLYTIWKQFGGLQGIRVLVTNDLRMRCVRSLLLGLRDVQCTVYGLAEPGMDATDLPPGSYEPITRTELPELLGHVDVVYCSPTVAADLPDEASTRDVVLDRGLMEWHADRDTKVMHPLPRGAELATDLDDTAFNGYWAQAANAMPVRMAMLALMFGSAEQL